jgi:hypothetical protein
MNSPRSVPDIPHIEVADPAGAFRKLEKFTRRILAVPKKNIDELLAQGKAKRRKRQ